MRFKNYMKIEKNINEGGNAAVIDRLTGERRQEAEKINLKVFGRQFVKSEVIKFLKELNSRYYKKYKEKIWNNFAVIESGYAFNGSSDALMNPDIQDSAYVDLKPYLGDIDVAVPAKTKEKLWSVLYNSEGDWFTSNMKYLGNNKPTMKSVGHQINSVVLIKKGDVEANLQIDFELTEYHGDNPSEFTKFAHSSSWEDMKASKFHPGLKGGVSHKYLLRALFGGASLVDDAVILTDKSTIEKPRIKKKGGAPIDLRMKKFSVDLGVRNAYEQVKTESGDDFHIDGKRAFKELPTSNSTYETNIETIFSMMFPEKAKVKDFWSFMGLVDLISKYHTKKQQEDTFERFLEIMWKSRPGKNLSQELEKNNAQLDFEIKSAAVNVMMKKIPHLKKYNKQIKTMTDTYYSQYGSGDTFD